MSFVMPSLQPDDRILIRSLLVYLATYLLGASIGCTRFLPWAFAGNILRFLVNFIIRALSYVDSVAEPRRILRKNPPAEQHLRELDWDLPFIMIPASWVFVDAFLPLARSVDVIPLSTWSVTAMLLSHYLLCEPIYYGFHVLLHESFFFKRSHGHHHASIITDAISGSVQPFAESLGYVAIFALAFVAPALLGCFSYELILIHAVFFDVMNCIGHCNTELVPRWLHWGPLKYLLYTTTFHSFHHTTFKFNYCLFCPFWDHFFGTVHPGTEEAYDRVMTQAARPLDVVFLVHGYDVLSSLRLPCVSPFLASQEQQLRLWTLPLYPFLIPVIIFSRFLLDTIVLQRYEYRGTQCASWCLPLTAHWFFFPSQYQGVAKLIERAVLSADDAGVRYIGLGQLNKAYWINHGGVDLLPILGSRKIRIVHGNTLTAAAVWRSICEYTTAQDDVFMLGATSKIGRALCVLLAQRGNRVFMMSESGDRISDIRKDAGEHAEKLLQAATYEEGRACGVWVIGKIMNAVDVKKHVPLGSLFLDYAVPHMPSRSVAGLRYINAAALRYNKSDTDLSFCHDVFGTVPACLAATIIHAREKSIEHECGEINIDEVHGWWDKATQHGFHLDCLSYNTVEVSGPGQV